MTKKIVIEIPDSLLDKDLLEWVRIKVERHLTAIEQAKVASVQDIIKPDLDLYDNKNGLNIIQEIKN